MLELAICLVIAITDGDTLKVRCGSEGRYEQITVRLAGIDAPEKKQPYGQRARKELAALCQGVQARIQPRSTDRWRRAVADVQCNGTDVAQYGRGYLTNTRKNTNTCTPYKPALARGIMVCGLTKIAKRRPFRRGDGAETSIKAIACNPFSKHLKPPPLAACISIVFPASAAAR